MTSGELYEHKEHLQHKEHKNHHESESHESEKRPKDETKKHDKKSEERAMESGKEKAEGVMDGLHLKKRDLWLVAGGAFGAIAALGLGRFSSKVRPAAVGAVREGYAFKEWVAGKAEKVKEDVEDIVAEGVHQYHSNLAATADSVRREKDILEKIEKMVEEKLAKMKTEQGEG